MSFCALTLDWLKAFDLRLQPPTGNDTDQERTQFNYNNFTLLGFFVVHFHNIKEGRGSTEMPGSTTFLSFSTKILYEGKLKSPA